MTVATAFRHPELGFELTVPEGVQLSTELPGIALAVRDGDDAPAGAFRPTLTVTAEEVGPHTELDDYVAVSLATQERLLRAPRLLDREPAEVAGRPGVRTLVHHNQDGEAVVVEQWRVRDGDLGYVISATCAALEFGELGEALAAVATTFRLP